MLKFLKNFSLLTGRKETDFVLSVTFMGCGRVEYKTEAAKNMFVKAGFPDRKFRDGKEGFYSVFGTVL